MKNYYEILEVNEHASIEIIEKAYRVLIKKYHPDLYIGEKKQYAERKTRDINEAYRILSDQFLKEQYDAELKREQVEEYVKKRTTEQEYINRNTYEIKHKKNIGVNQDNINRISKDRANKQTTNESNKEKNSGYKVGTFGGTVALVKEIFKNKPKKISLKDIKKIDMYAAGLTVIIIIILGIILWFIPFTNGWIRELIFENPLFSWMFNK